MQRTILVRGARQLLTLRGPAAPRRGSALRDLGIISDGAVLIANGTIQDVGPSRRVENLATARGAVELAADGHVVMPGFVDARAQLVCGPPLVEEYEARIEHREQYAVAPAVARHRRSMSAVRSSSRPKLELLASKLMREFLRHGTTTLEGRTGLGEDERTEWKILRAYSGLTQRSPELLVTFYGAAGLPPDYDGTAEEYLDRLARQFLPKIRRRRWASQVDVQCEAAGFPLRSARRYLAHAQGLGFGARVTAGDKQGDSAVRLAVETDAASVDGLVDVGDDALRLLAGSNTIATLLAGVPFQRGEDQFPTARKLVESGVAVALATGYNADSCPSCSLPAILSLACNLLRMTPAEAIVAATINGANALGCADRLGSIEYGKQADLIMLNVSDYREIPYHFGMNLVALTMKRGDVVYPRVGLP